MHKHLQSRNLVWLALAVLVGGVLAFVLGSYAITRMTSRDQVMGRVTVAGTPIGGLDVDSATAAILLVEERYVNRPAIFKVEGKIVSVDPHEAGFDLNESVILSEALSIGRAGNPFEQFTWWLGHIFSTVEVPVQGSIEESDIGHVYDFWDGEVISMPSSPGGVALEDGSMVPIYPASGKGVDRMAASPLVLASLLADEAEMVSIPTTTIEPRLTRADVDAAVAEAELMVSEPITLTYEGDQQVFTVDQLLGAFRSETVVDGDTATIVNSFDPEAIDSYLADVRSEFEDEPVNARFEIQGEKVVVIPGKNGTRIDEVETAHLLYQAGTTDSRTAELPIVEGAEPDRTTEYMESLEVVHLVSQFTTYHDCCQPRVSNIHNFADAMDGILLLPGQTLSLNDTVGPRTEEKGYLPAPTIIAGELEDTFGGGVSQFATTFYNAVFWGGYQDIEHKPHSYYFSRYPEGIEATINWRTPDLVFKNNRSHAILIDTLYTDTSITVRFFGNNDGRTIKGEQSGGNKKVWVAAEGGPDALHVKGEVSDRYALTEPGAPEYRGNPELRIDQQKQVQSAAGGWSVTVTRRILRGGTQLVEEREWVVRYLPKHDIYEVHPCKVPETSVACPTSSTAPPATTVPPATTTTTIPPATTTPAES